MYSSTYSTGGKTMNVNRWQTALALVIGFLLVASFTGCSFSPANPNSTVPSTQAGVRLEVLVSALNNLPSDPAMDRIKRELDEALGIDLKITAIVGDEDYKNQRSLRLASNTSADLFYVDRRDMIKLSQQGKLLDLTPYMDELQETKQFVGGDETMTTGTYSGKVFGIPKTSPAPQFTLWVREDWLEKVGMQPPSTLGQLMEVMKAFTEQDPDGNGKHDTYGFTGNPQFNALDQLFGAYGTTFPGKFYIKDGQLINSLYDPRMKQALEFMKEMVTTGVVDPDFLANTKGQQKDKAYQGQVGLLNFNWPIVVNSDAVKQISTFQPEARWIQLSAPVGPGGAYNGYDDFSARSILVMPATLQKEPDKLRKIIELLNYLSSTEGSRLVQYGLQGVHYQLAEEEIMPTENIRDVVYSHLYQLLGRDEMTYLRTKFPDAEPYYSFAIDQPRLKVYDAFIELPQSFNAADANRYIMEETFKFISNKRPLAEYDDFVGTLEKAYHYTQYMEAAVKQLAEQGFLQNE
ncbi:extracellular solute-binding protein [Paenibacillaceae bacterium]|nr:extracellular solute-binding protein [Paenibacillaceae bacterium]